MSLAIFDLAQQLPECASASQAKPLVEKLTRELCQIAGAELHPSTFLDEGRSLITLIPRQVRLDLWMAKVGSHMDQAYHAGKIFQLDDMAVMQIRRGELAPLHGHIAVSVYPLHLQDLKLTTEIRVFDTFILRENQSQLTLPLYEKNTCVQTNSLLRYGYEQGSNPRFVFTYERLPDINDLPLPDVYEKTALGVYHLKRFWYKVQVRKQIKPSHVAKSQLDQITADEWHLDRILLDQLSVGLEPAIGQVYQSASLAEFERWLEFANGGAIDPLRIEQANTMLQACLDKQKAELNGDWAGPLSDEHLAHWDEQGYVIIPGVLSQAETAAARAAIWDYLQMREDDPATWYRPAGEMKKIMVQLFAHPAFEVARQSPYIRQVFQQLWRREDLVVTTDRVGFNPPETSAWRFPGPGIHWDLELKPPIAFGTQALIYLTDVAKDQGAFSCVPGFHKKIDQWLANLPAGVDPQEQDWSQWPVKPIAAKAGDLIIWHQALPHGSSPNRANSPRMVQYINFYAC